MLPYLFYEVTPENNRVLPFHWIRMECIPCMANTFPVVCCGPRLGTIYTLDNIWNTSRHGSIIPSKQADTKGRPKDNRSMQEDLEDPETFCNPIEWLDEAEKGLAKWVAEWTRPIYYPLK